MSNSYLSYPRWRNQCIMGARMNAQQFWILCHLICPEMVEIRNVLWTVSFRSWSFSNHSSTRRQHFVKLSRGIHAQTNIFRLKHWWAPLSRVHVTRRRAKWSCWPLDGVFPIDKLNWIVVLPIWSQLISNWSPTEPNWFPTDSQLNPTDSQLNPTDSQLNPNWTQLNPNWTQSDRQLNTKWTQSEQKWTQSEQKWTQSEHNWIP